jgi:hypothetical protein
VRLASLRSDFLSHFAAKGTRTESVLVRLEKSLKIRKPTVGLEPTTG